MSHKTALVMNPRMECGGLWRGQVPIRKPWSTRRLRLETEPTLPTKPGTRGCAASSLLYGASLNICRGLRKCGAR